MKTECWNWKQIKLQTYIFEIKEIDSDKMRARISPNSYSRSKRTNTNTEETLILEKERELKKKTAVYITYETDTPEKNLKIS